MNDSGRKVELDASRDVLRRAPGCLLAILLLSVLFTAADLLVRELPPLVLGILGMGLGVAVLYLYARAINRRWGLTAPDPVQLILGDLTSLTRRSAHDFRLRLPSGTPFPERVLHEVLYSLKWIGTLLVFAGLGSVLYRLMVVTGLVES